MKRKIEENFSFFEHLIAVKLESITYTRFVFIYFLEYRFYHSNIIATYQRCFISSWQEFHFLQFNFKISILPIIFFHRHTF